MKNYAEFAESELQILMRIQDKFKEKHNIDSFKNWFYNADFELLRLYNDDEDEIFFKYIPIGTYSLNSKTWMWSWFNNSLIEKSKLKTLKIKEFGETNNFEKLIEGTFSSDEFDGWEFLAISKRILGGIGCYKINSENLNLYFLLTENIDSENNLEVKNLKQKTVDCGIHGYRRPAFICQHINLKKITGFEESFETTKGMELFEDEDFGAWCDDCEKIRIKYNGWNEMSEEFSKIKLVCEECYFDMKEFNLKKAD